MSSAAYSATLHEWVAILCLKQRLIDLLALQEYADALLTVYLSSMTKGVQSVGDLGDKLSVAYDKPFGARGRR